MTTLLKAVQAYVATRIDHQLAQADEPGALADLRAENERLRLALDWIAGYSGPDPEACQKHAYSALNGDKP